MEPMTLREAWLEYEMYCGELFYKGKPLGRWARIGVKILSIFL